MTSDKKWTLVVGLDFSECGTNALNQALQMAHRGGVLRTVTSAR